jgi:hypothetical protein
MTAFALGSRARASGRGTRLRDVVGGRGGSRGPRSPGRNGATEVAGMAHFIRRGRAITVMPCRIAIDCNGTPTVEERVPHPAAAVSSLPFGRSRRPLWVMMRSYAVPRTMRAACRATRGSHLCPAPASNTAATCPGFMTGLR